MTNYLGSNESNDEELVNAAKYQAALLATDEGIV
jgi:hypothetical protein